MGIDTAERPESAVPSSDAATARRFSRRSMLVVAIVVVAAVAGVGAWRWAHSLPVPVDTSGGSYRDPLPVGETLHTAIYVRSEGDLQLGKVEAGLVEGSAPAEVLVSACLDGRGPLIDSDIGEFPARACGSFEPAGGQLVDRDDYLVVSAEMLGAGDLKIWVDVHARDGIRSGTERIVIGSHPVAAID